MKNVMSILLLYLDGLFQEHIFSQDYKPKWTCIKYLNEGKPSYDHATIIILCMKEQCLEDPKYMWLLALPNFFSMF